MFAITGTAESDRATRTRMIVWDDGVLSGDPSTVASALAKADFSDGIAFGPPEGPLCESNHLRSPLCALFFLLSFYERDERLSVTGDVPSRGGPNLP